MDTKPAMDAIVAVLSRARLRLTEETATQESIEAALRNAGIECTREVRLSASDIIDVMAGRIGIEIKVKGSPTAIFRQIERYAKHDEIDGLILATNKAMRLPPAINGKPCRVISLGMGWL